MFLEFYKGQYIEIFTKRETTSGSTRRTIAAKTATREFGVVRARKS